MVIDVFMQAMEMLREIACFFFYLVSSLLWNISRPEYCGF